MRACRLAAFGPLVMAAFAVLRAAQRDVDRLVFDILGAAFFGLLSWRWWPEHLPPCPRHPGNRRSWGHMACDCGAVVRGLLLGGLPLLLAPLLSGCRAIPPACCARPCTTDSECNPSLWQVCVEGCCTCAPPDGGMCPAAPAPAQVLPALDGGCP